MKSFTFLTQEDVERTFFIDLSLPAGTKTGRLYITPEGGSEELITGGVPSVSNSGANIVIPASYVTEENFPAQFRLQINVDGGAFTDYATGRGIIYTPTGGGGDLHANQAILDAITAAFTTEDETKLDNIAAGATANATNEQLRDRATHTGTQTAATISDLTETVQDAVAALLQEGTNVTLLYNDASNSLSITAAGGGGGLDAEGVRDTIGVALLGSGLVSVVANDAGDTITVSTTATQNSTDAALRDRSTHTGTQSADTIVDGTTNHVFTAADDAKLTGIADGATANDTDANLKNRANHTGTQTSTTISDFTEAVQDAVAALLAQGTNVTLSYNDESNSLTINSVGDGTGLDAEAVRDAIGIALIGTGVISVTVNDAADTITISSTATANATDAALRDRSTHTGTQSADTIVDGSTNHVFTAADDTKLGGIASGATANDTDANLKNRANHTGTQSADTLTDGTTNKAFTAAERTKLSGIETGADNAPNMLPSYAGTGRTSRYDAINNVYNVKPSNLRKTRNALAKAKGNSGKCSILVLGDSMALTYGTTSIVDKAAFPRALVKNLAELIGIEQAGSGLTPPVAASGLRNDTWTTTGSVSLGATPGLLQMNASSTATFFPEEIGDGVEFYISDLSVNCTYSIDGEAPVSITNTGTAAQKKITRTGLAMGRHTLTINAPGVVYVASAQVTSTSSGVVMHNIAYGGTRAYGTNTGVSWTAANAATSMWRIREDPVTLAGISPDLVIMSLQGNDAFAGETAANSMAAMQTIRARYPNAEVLLIQAWEVTGTNATLWDEYYAAKYALAETLDCPFFDWRDRHGNQATAQAAGILAADNIHPNTGTTQEWGRNIAGVVAGIGKATNTTTTPSDNVVAGTSYTFAESDAKRWTVFTSGSAVTANIPLDAIDEMPIGTELNYRQSGAGAVEVTVTGGTRTSRGSRFKTNGAGAVATAKKIATNSWLIYGDLTT